MSFGSWGQGSRQRGINWGGGVEWSKFAVGKTGAGGALAEWLGTIRGLIQLGMVCTWQVGDLCRAVVRDKNGRTENERDEFGHHCGGMTGEFWTNSNESIKKILSKMRIKDAS